MAVRSFPPSAATFRTSVGAGPKILTSVALLSALSACSLGDPIVEDTSRQIAKGVVNSVIQQRFPGVNAAPYTDCVIDNASTEEILGLAQNAALGDNQSATATVITITQRPATTQCITQNAISAALG